MTRKGARGGGISINEIYTDSETKRADSLNFIFHHSHTERERKRECVKHYYKSFDAFSIGIDTFIRIYTHKVAIDFIRVLLCQYNKRAKKIDEN